MVNAVQPARTVETLLIGAFDLIGFMRAIRGIDDARLVAIIDSLYSAIGEAVTRSGGRVVKFMGDGALAVWPAEQADAALAAVIALRSDLAGVLLDGVLRADLMVKLHCGDVVAGEFGPNRAFDVMGAEVFTTFRLPARTVSLSAEAFRRLSPEMRTKLKKHTEPAVYIPKGDPRP